MLPNDGPGAWSMALLTLVVVLAAASLGFSIGRRRRSRGEGEAPVGSMVGATLGLLAFLLAFTFGMAASKHDARRKLVIQEANAIQTADLRADLLSPAAAARVHELFLEYVDLRLEVVRGGVALDEALPRARAQQDELWRLACDAMRDPERQGAGRLFLTALNTVIDLHSERLAVGAYDRIPVPLWGALLLLTAIAMVAVGYHAGIAGSARVLPLATLVSAFLTAVLVIADLDRPASGLLVVSQRPLEDLSFELHERAAGGERTGGDPAAQERAR